MAGCDGDAGREFVGDAQHAIFALSGLSAHRQRCAWDSHAEALAGVDRQRAKVDLFSNLAKPLFVPGTARALDLLEEFRDAETRLALVVDEYGDIEGLVTLNDLLSAVVGKSSTPTQAAHSTSVVRRDDGSWLVDGSVGTDDLRELLATTALPHEEDHDFHTAAGMVVAHFGRIPQSGRTFRLARHSLRSGGFGWRADR